MIVFTIAGTGYEWAHVVTPTHAVITVIKISPISSSDFLQSHLGLITTTHNKAQRVNVLYFYYPCCADLAWEGREGVISSIITLYTHAKIP